ncbi:hypothetical protein [Aestuariivirga sp.]|uniref:hypothetical protein n=1 Tax=Aestuariivirga sp. TaxID=2650926 RepID=UPI00391DBD29
MSSFRAIPAAFYVLGTVATHIDQALRMSWPWLLVAAGVRLVALLLMPVLTDELAADSTALIGQAWDALWLYLLYSSVYTVAFASIAVNWHRYVLEEEAPGVMDLLRLDAPVWRYVWNIVLTYIGGGVIFGAAILPIAIVARNAAAAGGERLGLMAAGATVITAVVLVGLVVLRLAIKLPAVAVDRSGYGFFQAWLDSGGNNVRLLGFFIMVLAGIGLPFLLIEAAALYLLSLAGEGALTAGGLVLEIAGAWLITIVGATMLSVLYAVFAEGRDV